MIRYIFLIVMKIKMIRNIFKYLMKIEINNFNENWNDYILIFVFDKMYKMIWNEEEVVID